MEYISTKDLAKKWNVTPKRIVTMAKNGQIKGAKLIGNSWTFPEDSIKPVDGRYKKEKTQIPFHFPNFFFLKISTSEMTHEEKEFYSFEIEFHKMHFTQSISGFESIYAKTSSKSLKAGCLYYLCYGYGILKKYDKALYYYNQFTYLLSLDMDNKKEICFLYYEIKAYIKYNSNDVFLTANYQDMDKKCHSLLATAYLYQELLHALKDAKSVHLEADEIISLQMNKDTSPLGYIYSHIHLALINSILDKQERSMFHFKEALSFAVKNEIFFPFVIYLNYFGRSIPEVAKDISKETLDDLIHWNSSYCEALNELANIEFKINSPVLSLQDYDYLGYLYRGTSSKEVAKIKGLSEQTICEKYKELRIKFNAESKKDLLDKYKSYLLNRE